MRIREKENMDDSSFCLEQQNTYNKIIYKMCLFNCEHCESMKLERKTKSFVWNILGLWCLYTEVDQVVADASLESQGGQGWRYEVKSHWHIFALKAMELGEMT